MHVIEVSQRHASIRFADGCLLITADGKRLGRVPIAEVSTVLLSTPRATCSVTAISRLAAAGTPVIFCDPSMKPAGMVLPFRGHHEIGARISAQATASIPLKRRIWQSLVRSKIAGQAHVLAETSGTDHGLRLLTKRVRSGDPSNVEGMAARRYWRRLLGPAFRRRRGDGLVNKMLDYGYAILRAAVMRSLCVAGLHPSIAIHHHNRSNPFALADDLIEPFRPAVDRLVAGLACRQAEEPDLTPDLKRQLAGCLTGLIPMAGEQRSMTDALGRSASSLAGVLLEETSQLSLPWIG